MSSGKQYLKIKCRDIAFIAHEPTRRERERENIRSEFEEFGWYQIMSMVTLALPFSPSPLSTRRPFVQRADVSTVYICEKDKGKIRDMNL